jgi:hypothetical protein
MEPARSTDRHRRMQTPTRPAPIGRRLAIVAIGVIALLLLAGCTPATSVIEPSPGNIATAEEAAEAVKESSPLFGGIGPQDPDLIGQADWWTAEPIGQGTPPEGWRVTYRVGWGDCPAGCIDEHTWTYEVSRDGTVTFLGEAGTPLSPEIVQRLAQASTDTGVGGRVTAGPVCPVETPGDLNCAPRAVDGAVLVVKAADGTQVGRLVSDASGLFRAGLQPGEYVLEPQPVEGLMGTAAPMPFGVTEGAQTFLDVGYDTGIR